MQIQQGSHKDSKANILSSPHSKQQPIQKVTQKISLKNLNKSSTTSRLDPIFQISLKGADKSLNPSHVLDPKNSLTPFQYYVTPNLPASCLFSKQKSKDPNSNTYFQKSGLKDALSNISSHSQVTQESRSRNSFKPRQVDSKKQDIHCESKVIQESNHIFQLFPKSPSNQIQQNNLSYSNLNIISDSYRAFGVNPFQQPEKSHQTLGVTSPFFNPNNKKSEQKEILKQERQNKYLQQQVGQSERQEKILDNSYSMLIKSDISISPSSAQKKFSNESNVSKNEYFVTKMQKNQQKSQNASNSPLKKLQNEQRQGQQQKQQIKKGQHITFKKKEESKISNKIESEKQEDGIKQNNSLKYQEIQQKKGQNLEDINNEFDININFRGTFAVLNPSSVRELLDENKKQEFNTPQKSESKQLKTNQEVRQQEQSNTEAIIQEGEQEWFDLGPKLTFDKDCPRPCLEEILGKDNEQIENKDSRSMTFPTTVTTGKQQQIKLPNLKKQIIQEDFSKLSSQQQNFENKKIKILSDFLSQLNLQKQKVNDSMMILDQRSNEVSKFYDNQQLKLMESAKKIAEMVEQELQIARERVVSAEQQTLKIFKEKEEELRNIQLELLKTDQDITKNKQDIIKTMEEKPFLAVIQAYEENLQSNALWLSNLPTQPLILSKTYEYQEYTNAAFYLSVFLKEIFEVYEKMTTFFGALQNQIFIKNEVDCEKIKGKQQTQRSPTSASNQSHAPFSSSSEIYQLEMSNSFRKAKNIPENTQNQSAFMLYQTTPSRERNQHISCLDQLLPYSECVLNSSMRRSHSQVSNNSDIPSVFKKSSRSNIISNKFSTNNIPNPYLSLEDQITLSVKEQHNESAREKQMIQSYSSVQYNKHREFEQFLFNSSKQEEEVDIFSSLPNTFQNDIQSIQLEQSLYLQDQVNQQNIRQEVNQNGISPPSLKANQKNTGIYQPPHQFFQDEMSINNESLNSQQTGEFHSLHSNRYLMSENSPHELIDQQKPSTNTQAKSQLTSLNQLIKSQDGGKSVLFKLRNQSKLIEEQIYNKNFQPSYIQPQLLCETNQRFNRDQLQVLMNNFSQLKKSKGDNLAELPLHQPPPTIIQQPSLLFKNDPSQNLDLKTLQISPSVKTVEKYSELLQKIHHSFFNSALQQEHQPSFEVSPSNFLFKKSEGETDHSELKRYQINSLENSEDQDYQSSAQIKIIKQAELQKEEQEEGVRELQDKNKINSQFSSQIDYEEKKNNQENQDNSSSFSSFLEPEAEELDSVIGKL